MVTATEFERWRVDPATLKQVSGGDLVPHQPKFEAERTSPVRATLILSGNSLPYLGLFDPAVVERFRLVPFPKPDNDFSKILELFLNRDEAASKAMLRLLVDYARAYPPGKRIDVPPAMATAIDDAIEEECGRFAPWMNRNIVDDPRGKITTDQLWNAWARDLFRAPAKDMIDGITRQDAIRALRLRFNLGPAKPIRIGQQIGRGWSGVRLKDAAELAAAEGAPPAGVQGSDIESI